MFPIGLSIGKNFTDEFLKDCHDAGITHLEICLRQKEDFAIAKSQADKYGLRLWSFHLPFVPFAELEPSRVALAPHTVEYFSELIRYGADIGIDKFVIHASGEPIRPEARAERMACAKETLGTLAEIADRAGAAIAVEVLPRTCLGRNSEDILDLLSADERLRVCFDTNHLLSEKPGDFIRRVGKKIITTHVSDYDLVDEKHWLPGEGSTDWNEILDGLSNIGYHGVWMYEVGLRTPDSILRSRDLLVSDFVRNARELFARQKPTVLGVPKK